jgi:head-tail adaptor
MRAGSLRHRVSIQTRTEASDGHDGLTETWSTVRSRMPALVTPLSGRELERAREIDPRISHDVMIRFYMSYPDELVGGRARFIFHDGQIGDRTLEIVTPPIEKEPRVMLTMQTREAA